MAISEQLKAKIQAENEAVKKLENLGFSILGWLRVTNKIVLLKDGKFSYYDTYVKALKKSS